MASKPKSRPKDTPAQKRSRALVKAEQTGEGIVMSPPAGGLLSKLPDSLRSLAVEARDSGVLASGVDYMALLHAMLVREVEAMESDQPQWQQIQAVVDRARSHGRAYVMIAAVQRIIDMGFARASRQTRVRDLIRDIGQQRKIEVDVVKAMRDMMTPTEVMELRRAVVEAIHEEVSDENVRARIAERIERAARRDR